MASSQFLAYRAISCFFSYDAIIKDELESSLQPTGFCSDNLMRLMSHSLSEPGHTIAHILVP